MKDNIEKSVSDLALTFIAYFLVLIITGVLKVNIITGYLPLELASSAIVSGYVSLTVSSFISILVIVLMVFILFLCNMIFEFNITEVDLVENFNLTILIFIAFDLLKLILALLLIEQDLSQTIYDDNFITNLKDGNWFYFDTIMKYLMIFSASLAYVFGLYNKKGYKKTTNLFIVFFILLLGLYVSTIDFFDTI